MTENSDVWQTYSAVAAIHAKGATPLIPPMLEYARPQDFATNPDWEHSQHFISTEYGLVVLHLWVDVPMDRDERGDWAMRIVERGVPDYNNPNVQKPPMSPDDCLGEDDFWDVETMGPARYCDDES